LENPEEEPGNRKDQLKPLVLNKLAYVIIQWLCAEERGWTPG